MELIGESMRIGEQPAELAVAQGAVGSLPYRGHGLLAGQAARRQRQE